MSLLASSDICVQQAHQRFMHGATVLDVRKPFAFVSATCRERSTFRLALLAAGHAAIEPRREILAVQVPITEK
jgi:hypothetical protein